MRRSNICELIVEILRGSSVDGMADHRAPWFHFDQKLRDLDSTPILSLLISAFPSSAFQFFRMAFILWPEPSASPARFWLDCCSLCPPVIKHIVFWSLLLGLGCLFLFQKLHERKQQPAKASLATAASHSSPTPSASPVSSAAGQPAEPKPTAILPPPPALKPKPTPMLPKATPMLPKPTPMLRPNPNGGQT